MIRCTIATDAQYADIEKLLRAEISRAHPRSDVRISSEKGKAVLHIAAQDIAALRAAFNGMTSILGIYEKTNDIA